MDKETKQIIKLIAEIQLEALETAKREHLNKHQVEKLFGQLEKLLGKSVKTSITNKINDLVDVYQMIIKIPNTIWLLDAYQISLCSKILSENAETWRLHNSQGVYGAFELLKQLNQKHGK